MPLSLLQDLKLYIFSRELQTNTEVWNFNKPDSLSYNASLWLLMYGRTKIHFYLDVDVDRDL